MSKERYRTVDRAMDEDRPEKTVIRSLWTEEFRRFAKEFSEDREPIYLTLPGSQGKDIKELVEAGLISLTEVHSISEQDQHKIVAVESSNEAVLELQRRFIGLRIKQVDIGSLVRGEGLLRWPEGDDVAICRARIVNLDINAPLRATTETGEVVFPVLSWIRKLWLLHARAPQKDWSLCLTLHAELIWQSEVNNWTRNFLLENLNRDENFRKSCVDFLGTEFCSHLKESDEVDFTALPHEDCQRLIMVMVPKRIAQLAHAEGWRVRTKWNLRYGGMSQAPMVTWLVRFIWDAAAAATPDALYREALNSIFFKAGAITQDGEVKAVECE